MINADQLILSILLSCAVVGFIAFIYGRYYERCRLDGRLEELNRWRVYWHEHRRWFAEFDAAAVALDSLHAKAKGSPTSFIGDERDRLRAARKEAEK